MAQIASTGFYAVVDYRVPSPIILKIGYRPGVSIVTPPGVVVIQPVPALIWPGGDDTLEQIRTPFEAFLQTLYGANATLTSNSKVHDLHSEMKKGGVTGQYSKVAIVDFMAFTAVLKRFQTLPNGEQVDLLNLGPGDVRPNINDLKRNGLDLMQGIITHLGIQGIYPYLYTKEGITFKELCDYLREWIPDLTERATYVYTEFLPILKSQKSPILTEAQITSLLKE